jgi:hypothetical protein
MFKIPMASQNLVYEGETPKVFLNISFLTNTETLNLNQTKSI